MKARSFAVRTILHSAALAALTAAAVADEGRRELKAHEHGHGKLDIAIEGNRVTLELDTPAADILGFESAATTPEQKAALANANALLAEPLKLFVVPATAGCTLAKSKVEIEAEEHAEHAAKDGATAGDHAGHADVEAEYELTCTSPAALTSIAFDFFQAFKGAQSLEVSIITPKGQTSQSVTRDKPRLELGGLM
jgi:uncharacterized protein involved in high-affinity Fe2+ transport